MKQNHHFIVPKDRFILETGKSLISTYTFNTHAAKSEHFINISQSNLEFRHKFCSVCGVQSFYVPRSNQDGVGVMPHCVTSGTIRNTEIIHFQGNKWEESFQSDNLIKKMSKE